VKVLIADDSPLMRERLATLISEIEGVELVGQAGSAPEALEAIERSKPDAVILDIRMPGGNGIQVLEALKKSTVEPEVIVLTAFPYPQYRKKCLQAGAKYFFDKSSEFEQIAEVLNKMQGSTTGESATTPESGLK
jgi:DNA-binding NarL/FixJ family response regulator